MHGEPACSTSPGTPKQPYGVYVHVPFCRMLCTYCDFVKYRGLEPWFEPYTAAVLREAESWALRLAPGPAASLYLGGGTPSALGLERLRALRDGLTTAFSLDAAAEFCLEANPEDVTPTFADGVLAAGFDRVSMGIQTFDDATLRRLGRLHTGAQAEVAVGTLRQAGLPSLSADLMFGLPGQSLASWDAVLSQAISLGLQHLSCYSLTIEPATPLGRQVARRRLRIPDDDAGADMYGLACARLRAAGYRHYEVSNWALPGHESRHNQGYWRGHDYVGLGPGAVGCVAGLRQRNVAAVAAYCDRVATAGEAVADIETLSAAERRRERLMLALRTAEGLELDSFSRATGGPLPASAVAAIARLEAAGMINTAGERLIVPEAHWGVLGAITATILAELS